jgi:hypothetical protein
VCFRHPAIIVSISGEGRRRSGDYMVHQYYYNMLGKPFNRQHTIDLSQLQLPRLDLSNQALPFTAEEVARIVRESRGLLQSHLGHSGLVTDVIRVFRSLWELDCRSFHLLNEASLVLLKKTDVPSGLKDYRPMSLIHSVGKMFSKGLAMRLAPKMHALVRTNQLAFIRG